MELEIVEIGKIGVLYVPATKKQRKEWWERFGDDIGQRIEEGLSILCGDFNESLEDSEWWKAKWMETVLILVQKMNRLERAADRIDTGTW